jgi:hypothetical protein
MLENLIACECAVGPRPLDEIGSVVHLLGELGRAWKPLYVLFHGSIEFCLSLSLVASDLASIPGGQGA